jgi:acyl-CoA reductase-like NAD-dependent aldehyde dehydrogenase
MINWTPLWRADLMPYGGFKQSGIGKRRAALRRRGMTEMKTVGLSRSRRLILVEPAARISPLTKGNLS